MASLFVIRGRDQGRHFTLGAGTQRIGRDPQNPIQLLDSEISRSHAEILSENGVEYELVDLQSSNGSSINGETVTRRRLTSGDRVQVGQTLMIFTGAGQPASLDAAHGVDIVRQSRESDASRIVSSLPQAADAALRPEPGGDRSLEVMYRTALAVGRTTEIPELLDRVLRLVFDWVEADRGCIMLRDAETGELQPAARCDREGKHAADRMTISRTILDYVMDRKEGVRTSDALGDQRWGAAQSIVQAGIREAICVPLQGRYAIVGTLYVDTFTSPGRYVAEEQRGRFTDEQLRLMTAIGHQAALAIEDTFYYSAMMQSERLAAMGQAIANLSHHIKNILQGIRGGSYLIDAGLSREDNDAVRRGWAMVEKNQERISHLVMDMLSFSKERQPEKREDDLNTLVADVIELMQVRADDLGCTLRWQPYQGVANAAFDSEALHRAVLNIVTNALDAVGTPQPSDRDPPAAAEGEGLVEVTIRAADEGGWWIDVADNGPGIPWESREKIFSPFESGKGTRGTGLGLPVSRKILKEHGGEIEVLDRAGGGTCFRLFLPADGDGRDDGSSLASHETIA